MALGRVSAFKQLDKGSQTNGASRENVGNSSLESPFAGLSPEFTGGAGGANSSSANTSGITGGDPSLASMGAAVASMGIPGVNLGLTGLGGLVGNAAVNAALGLGRSAAIGAAPSSLVSEQGNPVTFTGNQGLGGTKGFTGVIGNLLGSLGVPGFTAPSFAESITNPNTQDPTVAEMTVPMAPMSPNVGPAMGFSSGMAAHGIGTGSTFSGPGAAPGMFGDISMGGLNGLGAGPAVATGAGTGNASPGTSNFGGVAGDAAGGSLGGKGLGETGSGGVVGDSGNNSSDSTGVGAAPGTPGGIGTGIGDSSSSNGTVGDGTAGGIGGTAAGGEGGPGAPGGAPGGGDAGDAGTWHQGGFVDLEHDGGTDGGVNDNVAPGPTENPEVTTNLENGEFVINKQAAGRFGPLLNKLNEIGRSQQLKDTLGAILEGAAKTGFGALMR